MYPPDYLADLAVHLLAAREGNHFSAQQALDGAQRGTRGMVGATGCCIVEDTSAAPAGNGAREEPFYFSTDAQGYVMVNAREFIPGWPLGKGRAVPIRLGRWLLHAEEGQQVRHCCDDPRCVRISHLKLGSASENVGDALRRGRRASSRGERASSPGLCSPRLQQPKRSSPPSPQTAAPAAPRLESARAAAPETGWASPSKQARKRRRMAAAAAARESEAADGDARQPA